MVGDRPRADIEGAKALGMNAVWVRNRSRVFIGKIRPDYTIERLTQLKDLPIFGRSLGTR
jgi:FMN phosphatase YigB (HAD superfamily)